MEFWQKLRFWHKPEQPVTQRHGQIGEMAAKKYLQKLGYKFLVANFTGKRGEIDLVFRDQDCLVFVEVKARSSEAWTTPSRAVDQDKKAALLRTSREYLRLLKTEQVKFRFDVVEVLLEAGAVREVRHLQNFTMRRQR